MWLEWEILPHFPFRVRVCRELYGQRQSPSHWELESWLIKKNKKNCNLAPICFLYCKVRKRGRLNFCFAKNGPFLCNYWKPENLVGVVFCGTREKEKVITTPILLFSFVFFSFEGQLENFYFFIFGNLFTIHSGDTFYHKI